MRQTLEQKEKSLKGFMKNRWLYTLSWLFLISVQVPTIYERRSQFPSMFRYPGVPFWYSIWENISIIVSMLFALVFWWLRVYNYRREQMAAEQEALRKSAMPVEGVWPPPPVM